MKRIKQEILDKIDELDNILKNGKNILDNAPKGNLQVYNHKNNYQYYNVNKGEVHGKYISKKKEQKLIQALAQKEYESKLMNAATGQKIILEQALTKYDEEELYRIYDKMHEGKKKYINSLYLPDDEYIIKWKKYYEDKKTEYNNTHNNKYDLPKSYDEEGIYTELGERVKSKSEKIIADKLLKLDIPYVYEAPLWLEGYGYIKPDFVTLNIRTRKTYYFEHLGMMSDEDYCEKTIRKINCYERNGYYPGENLIFSYETRTLPINVKYVERMINKYLL